MAQTVWMNMKKPIFNLIALMMALPTLPVAAMTKVVKPIKAKAYFIEADNGLYEPLDLKLKKIRYNESKDFAECAKTMTRKDKTLDYTCTMEIPSAAKISKLSKHISANIIPVKFGASELMVRVEVNADARTVKFSTKIDDTGIDFDVAQFNDKFLRIQSKVAQMIIGEAMSKNALEIQVLESL